MFQGGPLTEDDSPVSYPYKLYRDMYNTNEVINQHIYLLSYVIIHMFTYKHVNKHQLWEPIRELQFTPVSVCPGGDSAGFHQRQSEADL